MYIKYFIKIIIAFFGVFLGGCIVSYRYKMEIKNIKRSMNKYNEMSYLANRWVYNLQHSKFIDSILKEKNIQTVAVYGLGFIGRNLYFELADRGIDVKYIIDQNKSRQIKGVRTYSLDDRLESVDLIIVTVLNGFDEIEMALKKKVSAKIVSIEEYIYRL